MRYRNFIFDKIDDLNWQVRRVVITGDTKRTKPGNVGKERELIFGYYPALEMAVLDVARNITDESDCSELRDYAQKLKVIGDEIVKATKGMQP